MTSSEQSTSSNPPITTGSRLGFTYGLKKRKNVIMLLRNITEKSSLKKKQKARKTHYPLQPVFSKFETRQRNLVGNPPWLLLRRNKSKEAKGTEWLEILFGVESWREKKNEYIPKAMNH